MSEIQANPERKQRALLIGVQRLENRLQETETLLSELRELVQTLGIKAVTQSIVPLRKPQSHFLLGKGKAHEVMATAREKGCTVIVFDDELSPAQQRNWEKELKGIAVIDRQEVILDIFAKGAQTREAMLQVELARMHYTMPRLKRAWTHLNRQHGGGTLQRDAGETQLELDQRILKLQISRLKRELSNVVKQRAVQRKQRLKVPIPTAAIVGYTNAGKSSLLNCLTGSNILVKDKLFATLDPTTRKLLLPSKQTLLLTDTVGFVRRLPPRLVEAFKATLEEAVVSNFLIHVLDVTSPDIEQHYRTTLEVLTELGAERKRIVTVFNKMDLSPNPFKLQLLRSQYPEACFISTHTGEGIHALTDCLEAQLEKERITMRLLIPYNRYDLVHTLHELGCVNQEDSVADGIYVLAQIPIRLICAFEPFVVNDSQVACC